MNDDTHEPAITAAEAAMLDTAARANAGDAAAAEAAANAYQVRLEKFEGPLDLLLHLIKRDEIDIYDIPIARITAQYLVYLDMMRELNLEVAGEFLVMASTLMRIKVKMLLPASPLGEEAEEGDPREALVQQLLEYRKFKEVAEKLREREEARRGLYERGLPESMDSSEPLPLKPVGLFDLVEVFRRVQLQAEDYSTYEVQVEPVHIDDCMDSIRRALGGTGRVLFTVLLSQCRRRIERIVTFMALLEMIKLGEINAEQEESFGDIWIARIDAPAP